jgi:hypothetical protein
MEKSVELVEAFQKSVINYAEKRDVDLFMPHLR